MSQVRSLLIIPIAAIGISISGTSCSSSTSVINDFFGIQMDLIDSTEFKIISYTVEDGIKFASSALMKKRVFAWAEFSDNMVELVITNNSPNTLPSSFVSDQFDITTTDGKVFSLDKGKFFDYPIRGSIEPNKTVTLSLGLPNNFW